MSKKKQWKQSSQCFFPSRLILLQPAPSSDSTWSIERDCRGCENNCVFAIRLLPDSNPLRRNVTVVQHPTDDIIHNWSLKPGPSVAVFLKNGTNTHNFRCQRWINITWQDTVRLPDAGAPWGSLFRIQIFLLQIREKVSCAQRQKSAATFKGASYPPVWTDNGLSLEPPPLLLKLPGISLDNRMVSGHFFWQETTWNGRSNESDVLFNSAKTGKFQQMQSRNLRPSATEAEARRCIIWMVVAGCLLWFILTQCQLLEMF